MSNEQFDLNWVQNYGYTYIKSAQRRDLTPASRLAAMSRLVNQYFRIGLDLLFDGTYMWLLSGFGLNRIDVQTNQTGFISIQGGRQLAFDGNNIWMIINQHDSSTIWIVDPTSNLKTHEFPCYAGDHGPHDIVFDGHRMWVTFFSSDTLRIYSTVEPYEELQSINLPGARTRICFDGRNVWIAGNDEVVIRSPSDPLVDVARITLDGPPEKMIFDGWRVWVDCHDYSEHKQKLIAFSAQEFEPTSQVVEIAEGYVNYATDLCYDGRFIWLCHPESYVQKFNPWIDSMQIRPAWWCGVGLSPRAMAFDGSHIWVAHWGSPTISRIPAFPSPGFYSPPL
ncbi:MAG: hypothetical protein ACFFD8_04365 [Candidatus Thorarchaeota archaeon]